APAAPTPAWRPTTGFGPRTGSRPERPAAPREPNPNPPTPGTRKRLREPTRKSKPCGAPRTTRRPTPALPVRTTGPELRKRGVDTKTHPPRFGLERHAVTLFLPAGNRTGARRGSQR